MPAGPTPLFSAPSRSPGNFRRAIPCPVEPGAQPILRVADPNTHRSAARLRRSRTWNWRSPTLFHGQDGHTSPNPVDIPLRRPRRSPRSGFPFRWTGFLPSGHDRRHHLGMLEPRRWSGCAPRHMPRSPNAHAFWEAFRRSLTGNGASIGEALLFEPVMIDLARPV